MSSIDIRVSAVPRAEASGLVPGRLVELSAAPFASEPVAAWSWELLADSLKALVLDVADKSQVLWTVIIALAVDMVDKLASLKIPAELLFHHQPVLPHVTLIGMRVSRHADEYIAVRTEHPSAFPPSVLFHWLTRCGDVLGCQFAPSVLMAMKIALGPLGGQLRGCESLMADDPATTAGTGRLNHRVTSAIS